MRRIDEQEFKNLTVQMLKAFADVCEREKLKYILDYGTLLGCARHQGFIPWDDDIDVTMPREDYEKIRHLFDNNPDIFGKNFKLSTYDNEYTVYKSYFNLIDVRTITYSPHRRRSCYYPVWIDIFPADGISDDDDVAFDMHQQCRQLLFMCQRPLNPGYGKLKILRGLKNAYDMRYLPERFSMFHSLAKSVENSLRLTNYFSPYGMRDIIKRSYFEDIIYGIFEEEKFRIPKDYDERLTQLYGDYMQLPPLEQRTTHVVAAYWKD